MPQIASAKKRVKVSARQTEKNNLHRARARTAIKNIRALAGLGKKDEAAKALPAAQKYLDKAAKVRAIHPRTAARYKSRLADVLKGVKPGPAAKAVPKKATAEAPAKKASPKKAP